MNKPMSFKKLNHKLKNTMEPTLGLYSFIGKIYQLFKEEPIILLHKVF